MVELPATYDNLDKVLGEAWSRIAQGAEDRRSAFRTMQVATIGADGAPRVRTVVLRHASTGERTVFFHTDARSAKVAEICADPRVALHFYSPADLLQLRIAGTAAVHRHGGFVDDAWANTPAESRANYRAAPAPASCLRSPDDASFVADDDQARQMFVVVPVKIASIEWLYLHPEGHRRALFKWDDAGRLAASWLVP